MIALGRCIAVSNPVWDKIEKSLIYTVHLYSNIMYAKVKQLRERGKRRGRSLDADDGSIGRLIAFIVEGYPALHLFAWGPPSVASDDLYFPLYQPEIVGLRDSVMLVRGWQRDSLDKDESATTLQEWAIEILREPAPITDGILHGPKR